MFESLLDYSYSEVLHSEPQFHPALFTESAVSVFFFEPEGGSGTSLLASF